MFEPTFCNNIMTDDQDVDWLCDLDYGHDGEHHYCN